MDKIVEIMSNNGYLMDNCNFGKCKILPKSTQAMISYLRKKNF